MSFISYAQNREDVMLWRALGHVAQGFYIDVGANHPEFDSITKAFYDRGWSGINIEPLAVHVAELQAARTRDINLACAVGAEEGEIELFESDIRGHATAARAVAEMHERNGNALVSHRVPLRRLDSICAAHAHGQIHFLKIDVEGFEEGVLRGMDLQRYRPWIVLVEATLPNSRELNTPWEPLILGNGYCFAYFDGLNRFYVANEHPELLAAFQTPPNVFDDFVPLEQVRLEGCLDHANTRLTEIETVLEHTARDFQEAQAEAQSFQARLAASEALIQQLRHDVQLMHDSTSWRISRPIRVLGNCLNRLKRWWNPPPLALVSTPPIQPGPEMRSRFEFGVLPARPRPPQGAALHVKEAQGGEARWVRITGHIEGHYSLAIVNRRLALALENLAPGRVGFVPCHHQPYENPQDVPRAERRRLFRQIGRHPDQAAQARLISLVHHYPLVRDSLPARQRFAIFFWEETSIPAAMIDHLNENFHGLFVATNFVKKALRDSGCCLPVFVIPFGVDHVFDPTLVHPPGPRRLALAMRQAWQRLKGVPQAALGIPAVRNLSPAPYRSLRFLHVSSAFDRKGIDILLSAFFAQFSALDPVELYIKTFPNPHNDVHARLQALREKYPQGPCVIVDEQVLTGAEMVELYRSAQAVVLPSRGEGFNLPAAEAMALGIPVITTGHGGQADFCTRRTAQLIPFRFTHSASHLAGPDACWVEPDARRLGELMRDMFHKVVAQDPGLDAQRQRALAHVRGTYRWARTARAILDSAAWLEAHDEGEEAAGRQRIALLSPWAARCGVAAYTQGLFHAIMGAERYRLEVYCDQRTTPQEAATQTIPCQPTWQLGNGASVLATLKAITERGCDVLVVQHQPSLFRLDDEICDLLAERAASACIVVLELHSTQQLMFEHRLSERAVAALQGLDRIIVHQCEDLNNLLALGLVENVMMLPLGVVPPLPESPESSSRAAREQWGIAPDTLVIGSFGFAFPHKGIDTLVESLRPLVAATGRNVHLLCVNAAPNGESERLIEEYQALAVRLGVDQRISWFAEFQPIEECQRLLSMADYIVLPYKDTRESASASVTVALSTRKPVLVSPLHIFQDLGTVTHRLPAATPEAIAQDVATLEAQPETRAALSARQENWLSQLNTHTLSRRFEALLQGLRIDRQLQASTADTGTTLQSAGNAEPKQLLVDVSELYFRDARTGIQRVVRSVLGELLSHPPAGYRVCPVFATVGQPYRYTGKFFVDDRGQVQSRPEPDQTDQTLSVGEGDIFLGLDLGAHLFPEAEARLQAFREAGVRIHFVVYDLIPLRHPQFSDEGLSVAFARWMQSLARQADGLHCISATVAEDVRAWLYRHATTLPLPVVSHFHLGADIEHSAPTSGMPDGAEHVLGILASPDGGKTFLTVSTIEPRKGQIQTLDAFEQLWREGSADRLVLVGKAGWKMEGFIERLRSHPELGRRLFWLEGISDEYLERIYGTAACLIAASAAEGFGLPLIEAAQRGVPIIARDIPVFREVAGNHAFYFAGASPEDLARAVRDWKALDTTGQAPASTGMSYLTWKESVAMLLETTLPPTSVRHP